ncbi:MAG: hypothetical protein M3Z23_19505 [Acidobacteriota bacterium]|nr:hypothetical protein [Acidobacteriota bacterium]
MNWKKSGPIRQTSPGPIFGSLRALIKGTGDIADTATRSINPYLGLVPGDIALSLLRTNYRRNGRIAMSPAGYIVLPHAVRLDRPVQAYAKWMARIPLEYAQSVLGRQLTVSNGEDLNQIALLKHYRSLMPMAQEARKPIFHLKPADGALGAHLTAANAAGKEFEALARELLSRVGLHL